MRTTKRKKERTVDIQLPDRANKIALVILTNQRKLAGYLERKTCYWNKLSKLIGLILFVAVMGGFSLYLLLKTIL